MLINRLQKLQWIAALAVIVLAIPSHAESSSSPPLKPGEVIVKTKDGCGFVIDNSKNPAVAAFVSKQYSELTWGGACIDGLAMGEGRVSEGEHRYTDTLPTRGWRWYGRGFGATETRSESGSSTIAFAWDGKSIFYNTLSTSKPVWDMKFAGTSIYKRSRVSDENRIITADTVFCGLKAEMFPECRNDPMKFSIYAVSVFDRQAEEGVYHTCPDPRSTQGCEALWAQHAGPVIERIKAFVAENEPKAEAHKREIAQLLATRRPSPQARQDEAASDAAKRTAQLAERAEYIAETDRLDREYKERDRKRKEEMKKVEAEVAAAEKAQAERSAQDRREALGILVGAIGQYQQQKTSQRQAQYEEQPRIGTPAAGLSQQQISACSEEIKRTQIESQSWGGDANDVAARLGQFQKNLFEGKCSGHPEAQAYIAGANKMLGYGGSASGGNGPLPPLASAGYSGNARSNSPSEAQSAQSRQQDGIDNRGRSGDGKCTPLDQYGKACVTLIGNTKTNNDSLTFPQTAYKLKLKNSCDKVFTVGGTTLNVHHDGGDNVQETGISPGGITELVCVDNRHRQCGGFTSWYVRNCRGS